ncbi:MAG: ABC transporter ATP-binding protein [Alphaproteobacteria bacterium]|uniref:ABC transporter ATP-binding protein n=1 Tax=Aestuariivirga sp. TaxID=2650926 RepID=UPI00301A22C2|nr:ABC transporter ATP-binding protein [Alphaproteobacteria bacterium]
MSLLSVQNLRVRYSIAGPVKAAIAGLHNRFVDAVIDVSLEIEPGSTLAIVGESGSGKTTLARAVIGLTPFTGGNILFDGKNPFALGPHPNRAYHRDVAMMFQDPVSSLSPRRTVKSLITEPFVIHGLRDRDLGAEAHRLLSLVGLPSDFAGRYPHQLSGGQARRVGVARAISLNPKLIIADEPTAGLDVSVQGEILNLLGRLQAKLGLSFMIITHNLAVVRHVSDRTAIMYMGRIVEEGPTQALFRTPRHPYAAALIAAQPNPDPARRRSGPVLTGEVTSLRNRPSGCEFNPRCDQAREICRISVPNAEKSATGQNVRCHNPLW